MRAERSSRATRSSTERLRRARGRSTRRTGRSPTPTRPPASSTIGSSAARSQSASSTSTAASSEPSATSTCCQKSPRPRACQTSGSSSARSRASEHETDASASACTRETPIRSPFANAPAPRAAHQRRPSAGAETTPSTSSPSRSSASSVAHTGIPREKFRVPSIGSTIQRVAPPSSPSSSPNTPSPGRSRGDPLPQRPLDGAVGVGDRRQVGLRLDAQIGGAEAGERQRVGVVCEREGEVEIGVHAPT